MGMGGQRHALATLPLGKTQYPLYRRLVGPQGQSGQVAENLTPTGIRSLDRPARSESLYRLSCRGQPYKKMLINLDQINVMHQKIAELLRILYNRQSRHVAFYRTGWLSTSMSDMNVCSSHQMQKYIYSSLHIP
jgi:hypothetical protein